MYKIATWNVNSLRVRLPQVLAWLAKADPDVLALQETKLLDADFPREILKNAGYESVFAGQKTYNGMAILSKMPIQQVTVDFKVKDEQRRLLAVTIGDLRIINLYVPNGESVVSLKYEYKLKWLNHLHEFLQEELSTHQHVLILGDFNIAPHDIDVYDPIVWQNKVLFSEPERNAFQALIKLGFHDCLRLHSGDKSIFTWWDYRMNAFKRNLGLRIDHILINQQLLTCLKTCYIDILPRQDERPSDHTPVIAEFEMSSQSV